MNKPIILGLHKEEALHMKMMQEVGLCALCEEPVYFSGRGISGEISYEELRNLTDPKYIGRNCLITVSAMAMGILSLPYDLREKVKEASLEQVKKGTND